MTDTNAQHLQHHAVFNLKETVKVRLTDEGRQAYLRYLRKHYTRLTEEELLERMLEGTDTEGYSSFGFWYFIHVFGDAFPNSLPIGSDQYVFFEDNDVVLTPVKLIGHEH